MPFTAQQILDEALNFVSDLASDAGIDAGALFQAPLPSGILLKGRDIPVTDPKYRGTCNVLFYENTLPSGNTWPFLRFFTFKHGGVERRFNGLRWFHDQRPFRTESKRVESAPKGCVHPRVHSQISLDEYQIAYKKRKEQEAAYRWQRFQRLCQEYQQASSPNPMHPWLAQRLRCAATPAFLARSGLRQTHAQRFLLPITHQGSLVAFQEFITLANNPSKKIYTAYEGALKGSSSWIAPCHGWESLAPIICEGYITGLTLALHWKGPIQVALNANNLKYARRNCPSNAIFAHDQDCWKRQHGNVGLDAALEACQPGDRLLTPYFSKNTLQHQPTDFNDLLMHEGVESLVKCINMQLDHVS